MKFEEITDMAEQAMSKAMMQLMRSKEQAYITCVLLNLPRTFTNEIETAGVNGIQMQINPEFFLELPESERRFLLVHEAWHIGLMDMVRLGTKDPEVWNQACDHYINLMIDEQKDPMPKFIDLGLKDPKYSGWEKEDIYNNLMQNPHNQKKNKLSGDLQSSGDEDGASNKLTGEQVQELEKQISNIIQQAAMQTKMMGGKVPSDVEQY